MHPAIRRKLAVQYQAALPDAIRQYLNSQGVSDRLIETHKLGWTGRRIVIPIFGRNGEIIQFRYAKSPYEPNEAPAILTEVGGGVELYGWDTLLQAPHRVVICARELDRLVLESRGIPAVSSTGGAQTFLPEWAPYFEAVKYVYVCFDHGRNGESAARDVKAKLTQAKSVRLPAEVGDGGTLRDYFVRLRNGLLDFEILLAIAATVEETNGDSALPQ